MCIVSYFAIYERNQDRRAFLVLLGRGRGIHIYLIESARKLFTVSSDKCVKNICDVFDWDWTQVQSERVNRIHTLRLIYSVINSSNNNIDNTNDGDSDDVDDEKKMNSHFVSYLLVFFCKNSVSFTHLERFTHNFWCIQTHKQALLPCDDWCFSCFKVENLKFSVDFTKHLICDKLLLKMYVCHKFFAPLFFNRWISSGTNEG